MESLQDVFWKLAANFPKNYQRRIEREGPALFVGGGGLVTSNCRKEILDRQSKQGKAYDTVTVRINQVAMN